MKCMLSFFLNNGSTTFKYKNIPCPLDASLFGSRRAFMLVNMSTPESSDSAYRERTPAGKVLRNEGYFNLFDAEKMKSTKLSV